MLASQPSNSSQAYVPLRRVEILTARHNCLARQTDGLGHVARGAGVTNAWSGWSHNISRSTDRCHVWCAVPPSQALFISMPVYNAYLWQQAQHAVARSTAAVDWSMRSQRGDVGAVLSYIARLLVGIIRTQGCIAHVNQWSRTLKLHIPRSVGWSLDGFPVRSRA